MAEKRLGKPAAINVMIRHDGRDFMVRNWQSFALVVLVLVANAPGQDAAIES
jgi:hypothetical protein